MPQQHVNQVRLNNFDEFIGQEKLVNTIKILIDASKKKKQQLTHILFHGIPGVGKTSLANIVAQEMDANIIYSQGPLLQKPADILGLFGAITKKAIIFIDEIHSINKNVEELLYSIMEEGVIDVNIGKEGESKFIRMNLPPFTLIGATTQLSKLTKPLKDRFGYIGKLTNYTEENIVQILLQYCKKLKVDIKPEILYSLAPYTFKVPRKANNLLNLIIKFSISKNIKSIDKRFILETLNYVGIYKYGLTDIHIEYLKALLKLSINKAVAIDTISGILGETKSNIEKEIEPILLLKNLIQKTSRGRKITSNGIEYISKHK